MNAFEWAPVSYVPDRRQLSLPLDERPPDYRQKQRNRKREARLRYLATCPRCAYCGVRLDEKRKGKMQRMMARPTVDHLLPKSRGGTDAASNLVLSCNACNVKKGDRTPEEWAADILRVVGKSYPRRSFSQRLRMLAAAVAVALPFLSKGGAT